MRNLLALTRGKQIGGGKKFGRAPPEPWRPLQLSRSKRMLRDGPAWYPHTFREPEHRSKFDI